MHLAQTAERAKFDFLFLAEGLRLREQNGQIYDLDVVGRPDTFTVLAALAAVTDRLGLAGTINSTFNEPYEVARQFATPRPPLRRPGRLERRHLLGRVHRRELPPRRLPRRRSSATSGPSEFLRRDRELFDSWRGDEIVADKATGVVPRATPTPAASRHRDEHFDIDGRFNVPRSPQGRPVIFQAGDSDEGREFAAATADAIFTRHGTLEAGPGLLRRRQGPAGPLRPHAATSC